MPVRRVLLGLLCLGFVVAPASVSADESAEPDTVQVFLSHNPESFNDFTAVFARTRVVSGGAGVIEQTLAALMAGPDGVETAAGYFSDFHNLIVPGPSTCKGQDFALMVTMGVATVQLCHLTQSAGIGQDARAQSEINNTLMQFGGITKVIVLGSTGHCLFDESGMDLCLM